MLYGQGHHSYAIVHIDMQYTKKTMYINFSKTIGQQKESSRAGSLWDTQN